MYRIMFYIFMVAGLLATGCSGCSQSALNMQNPAEARVSEIVLIKIVDNNGDPVSGARIYSPVIMGETDADGNLLTFFKDPGDYDLLARKGISGEAGFAETTGEITIVPGNVELVAYGGVEPIMPPGSVYEGDQHYRPGMLVRFYVKNSGNTEIVLNNTAPWIIQTMEGIPLYNPVTLQVIVELSPGEQSEWVWDQIDDNGLQIEPGGYDIILNCSEGEYGLRFWILPEGITP